MRMFCLMSKPTASVAVLVVRNVKPIHAHDCSRCTFLGTLNGEDLYHCAGEGFVRRFGSDGPEYGSLPLDGINPRPGTAYAFSAALFRRLNTAPHFVPNAYTSDVGYSPKVDDCTGCGQVGTCLANYCAHHGCPV